LIAATARTVVGPGGASFAVLLHPAATNAPLHARIRRVMRMFVTSG
jgi:hypothetical protein